MGYRQSGISIGGALDSHALRVANALVGNEDSAAGLEATLGNLRLRFDDQRVVAWCGGAFAVRIGDENLPPGHAGLIAKERRTCHDRAESRLARLAGDFWRDRCAAGSRQSLHRFARKFRWPRRAGLARWRRAPARRTIGSVGSSWRRMFGDRRIAEWTAPSAWVTTAARDRFLRFVRGPDWSRFTAEAQTSLVSAPFTVTLDSDRMGARLDGPDLPRHDPSDLAFGSRRSGDAASSAKRKADSVAR